MVSGSSILIPQTSQEPASVMDAMEDYYRKFNANVHRGSYQLANEVTAILEGARDNVRKVINANSTKEVVFTKMLPKR